jgi:SAM-dependent methyltransferase
VTGLDSSEPSLAHARAHADGLDVAFVHGDMRELAFDTEFDGALNLFSSFGYFATQQEDERVLAGIARALRPGGRLVIDVVNPPSLIARLRPQDFDELPDGHVLLHEVGYDVRSGRSAHTLTIVRPDGSRVRRTYSIRMYTAPELESMLERAGFRVVELHGGFDGAELTRETWRLIVTAGRTT